MAKKVILTMVAFTLLLTLGGGLISQGFSAIIGGGIAESYIYPLYAGIILLAGLLVGCTCVILDKLDTLSKR